MFGMAMNTASLTVQLMSGSVIFHHVYGQIRTLEQLMKQYLCAVSHNYDLKYFTIVKHNMLLEVVSFAILNKLGLATCQGIAAIKLRCGEF